MRAGELDSLRPDLVILQECGKPEPEVGKSVWFGDNPTQGVGVVARGEWSVEAGPIDPVTIDSVYPVLVSGPTPFNMLAVWAQPRPTYVRAVLDGVMRYRDFLRSTPSIVVGDFNSHVRWDGKAKVNHTTLATHLREVFGLVSAYHAAAARSDSTLEEATCYWQWKQTQPFHLDYCFIPADWVHRLGTVTIGGYEAWADKSDHRPLMVEILDWASVRSREEE
jgi:hypothetical protein